MLWYALSQPWMVKTLMGSGWRGLPDQALLDSLDDDLRYAITVEGKMALEDVENYDEVGASLVLCMPTHDGCMHAC